MDLLLTITSPTDELQKWFLNELQNPLFAQIVNLSCEIDTVGQSALVLDQYLSNNNPIYPTLLFAEARKLLNLALMQLLVTTVDHSIWISKESPHIQKSDC